MKDKEFWTIFMICLLVLGAMMVVRKHVTDNQRMRLEIRK